jgi:hypothetical protein
VSDLLAGSNPRGAGDDDPILRGGAGDGDRLEAEFAAGTMDGEREGSPSGNLLRNCDLGDDCGLTDIAVDDGPGVRLGNVRGSLADIAVDDGGLTGRADSGGGGGFLLILLIAWGAGPALSVASICLFISPSLAFTIAWYSVLMYGPSSLSILLCVSLSICCCQ